MRTKILQSSCNTKLLNWKHSHDDGSEWHGSQPAKNNTTKAILWLRNQNTARKSSQTAIHFISSGIFWSYATCIYFHFVKISRIIAYGNRPRCAMVKSENYQKLQSKTQHQNGTRIWDQSLRVPAHMVKCEPVMLVPRNTKWMFPDEEKKTFIAAERTHSACWRVCVPTMRKGK